MDKRITMNYSISNLLIYINKYAYPIIFILFALWMCVGIFPLMCYEGDSNEVILGCEILYHHGWQFPPEYCYEYRMQPLTVITIVVLKHILPFLTCEQIYCLLSTISSFIFLIGSIEFAQHITKYSRTKILIAAILLPEMYAIAMYPNSAILAATCFIWAFINIIKNRHWAAILLMCIAPLFRIDVVIVYPAILPLLLLVGKTWKKSIIFSAIYCTIIVIIVFLLFLLFKADVISTFEGYQKWNEIINIRMVIIAIFGFYSITYFILLPIGIIRIGKQKSWKELFLVLMPIILLHFIYSSMGCAAKHYLYIAPFVIIAGVRGFAWICDIGQRKMWVKWLILLAIVLILIASVRINKPNRPGFKQKLIISIFSKDISDYRLSVGIGAGQTVPTQDEMMLASGQLLYPWYIQSFKKELSISNKRIKKTIDSLPTSDIVFIDWGIRVPVLSEYMKEHNSVRYHQNNEAFTVSNAKRCLTIRLDENYNGDKDSFWRQTKAYCLSLHRKNVYIITPNLRSQLYFDSISQETDIKKVAEMLYKINISNIR